MCNCHVTEMNICDGTKSLTVKQDETSPATVEHTKGEGTRMIETTSKGPGEICSAFPEGFELRMGRICEENTALVAAVDEYKVRVKNFRKKIGDEKLNRMRLLSELKRSKKAVERVECENKVL